MSGKPPCASDRPSIAARDATLLLGAVLACIYALDAADVIGVLAGEAAILFGIAALQAAWLFAARHERRSALLAGAVLNLLLVAIWIVSRTAGLPIGPSGRLPVGLLDSLCTVDSIAVGLLSAALALRGSSHVWRAPRGCRPLAIGLALASLSALHAAGSTTSAANGGSVRFGTRVAATYRLYCHLL